MSSLLSFGCYCRSSTLRSCSWWKPKRKKSGRSTSVKRSKWTSARKCTLSAVLPANSNYVWAEGQFLCVTLHLPWDLSLTSMCIPCHREYSTQLNASRLKLLQAQDDLVRKMKEAAEKQLQKVGSAENDDYPKLLEALIIQVCTPWS